MTKHLGCSHLSSLPIWITLFGWAVNIENYLEWTAQDHKERERLVTVVKRLINNVGTFMLLIILFSSYMLHENDETQFRFPIICASR